MITTTIEVQPFNVPALLTLGNGSRLELHKVSYEVIDQLAKQFRADLFALAGYKDLEQICFGAKLKIAHPLHIEPHSNPEPMPCSDPFYDTQLGEPHLVTPQPAPPPARELYKAFTDPQVGEPYPAPTQELYSQSQMFDVSTNSQISEPYPLPTSQADDGNPF